MDEAIEAMTDQAFAVLADRPPYMHDGVARLRAHLRENPQHVDAVISRDDLLVTSAHAEKMTAAQWALVNDFRAQVPEATVSLRLHKLSWKRDMKVGLAPVFGILVTQRLGPFTFRREYAASAVSDLSMPVDEAKVKRMGTKA
jgi:hypothetical protein